MKFSAAATLALLTGPSSLESFSVQSSLPRVSRSSLFSVRLASSSESDFDSILGEGSSYKDAANSIRQENNSRRSDSSSSPVIRVPDGSPAATVTLASSVAASDVYGDDLALEDDQLLTDEGLEGDEEVAYDPLVNNEILKRQHEKKVQREQRKAAGGIMRYVKNPLLLVKGKDFSDITITVLIPAVVSFVVLRKASELFFGKLGQVADDLYLEASEEITDNMGDLDEIEKIYKKYTRKLFFDGAPSYVNERLLQRFAQHFVNNANISPKSMRSFAHLISLMKVSDKDAAESLVNACRKTPEGIYIVAKILFVGTQLCKSEEGQRALRPLIERAAQLFGGMEVAMQNQRDMGREAYRDAVAEAGPSQKKLLPGYELLGLDKETATSIYLKTKELGFLSRTELTKKEREDYKEAQIREMEERMQAIRDKIAEDGTVIDDPEELGDFTGDEDEDVGGGSSGVGTAQECSKCGYILVVAPGREGKFFNSGFTCPECGASKDQFNEIDINEE